MKQNHFQEIPLSILDLALILEGYGPTDSFAHSVSLAQRVEELNYHRYWLAEHHNMDSVASSATVVLIGHIAGHTKTLRVGSGGIMLPNHAPLIVAEQFGTLASLYPHRIDLGLGRAPGTDQTTAFALRRDHKAVLGFDQSILEIQGYFQNTDKRTPVRAIPGEGLDIPIWVLGSSVNSAHIAAALGLPYSFASHFAPAQLMQAAQIYREEFQPSSQLGTPYFMPAINVIAADSQEEAAYLATSSIQLLKGIITNTRRPLPPPTHDKIPMTPIEAAAYHQMSAVSIQGDPEMVGQRIRSFVRQTNADELMITSHIYNQEARQYSYQLIKEIQQSS